MPEPHRKPVSIAPRPVVTKRARTPPPLDGMPPGCFVFSNTTSGLLPIPATKKQKREKYSKTTCLRCQNHGQKCSGGFPCHSCVKHWEVMQRRSQGVVYWKACFDSDIEQLMDLAYVDIILGDLERLNTENDGSLVSNFKDGLSCGARADHWYLRSLHLNVVYHMIWRWAGYLVSDSGLITPKPDRRGHNLHLVVSTLFLQHRHLASLVRLKVPDMLIIRGIFLHAVCMTTGTLLARARQGKIKPGERAMLLNQLEALACLVDAKASMVHELLGFVDTNYPFSSTKRIILLARLLKHWKRAVEQVRHLQDFCVHWIRRLKERSAKHRDIREFPRLELNPILPQLNSFIEMVQPIHPVDQASELDEVVSESLKDPEKTVLLLRDYRNTGIQKMPWLEALMEMVKPFTISIG